MFKALTRSTKYHRLEKIKKQLHFSSEYVDEDDRLTDEFTARVLLTSFQQNVADVAFTPADDHEYALNGAYGGAGVLVGVVLVSLLKHKKHAPSSLSVGANDSCIRAR